MREDLAAHQIQIGLGGGGFRAICTCGWRSEQSWERTSALDPGRDHKRLLLPKAHRRVPVGDLSVHPQRRFPEVSTAMNNDRCPVCRTTLIKPSHCEHCGWSLITLKEWRKLPPFQQGYVLYAQGAWPRSEIKQEKNPHPRGSTAWTAFEQGAARAALAAQDSEE